MGLIGGVMGLGPMLAIAIGILVDPPGAGRGLAVVPMLMAAVYAPAVWASLARTNLRQAILRGSVIGSLMVAFAGSFLFGFAVLVVLLPPTALLWLASGGRLGASD